MVGGSATFANGAGGAASSSSADETAGINDAAIRAAAVATPMSVERSLMGEYSEWMAARRSASYKVTDTSVLRQKMR